MGLSKEAWVISLVGSCPFAERMRFAGPFSGKSKVWTHQSTQVVRLGVGSLPHAVRTKSLADMPFCLG